MRAVPGPVEWLTFPDPGDERRQFRVNVSFLLSSYRCIFGRGCPGVLDRRGCSDLGCCSHGVELVDERDAEHVAAMVEELTAEDADNVEQIRSKGWFHRKAGRPFKTRMLGRACIFANREGGPAGKPGCAFHHLALRTGRHPADTKPEICWSIPLNVGHEEPIEPNGLETTVVTAFSADAWGGTIDWWCIDTPDAYGAPRPVYRTFEYELRKAMGDSAYERMVELLDEIPAPRWPMPAQRLPVIG